MLIKPHIFYTEDMYCAVDKQTGEILIGGGAAKMLPFCYTAKDIAPTILRDKNDVIRSSIPKRCKITVELIEPV